MLVKKSWSILHASLPCLLGASFFFKDTATTEIYTLSYTTLFRSGQGPRRSGRGAARLAHYPKERRDRKSTRLNSSHVSISYAVFCLKKKKTEMRAHSPQQSSYAPVPVPNLPAVSRAAYLISLLTL